MGEFYLFSENFAFRGGSGAVLFLRTLNDLRSKIKENLGILGCEHMKQTE